MSSKRIAQSWLVLMIAASSAGCASPNVRLTETVPAEIRSGLETIRLDNCDGSQSVTQTAERVQSMTLQSATTTGSSYEAIKARLLEKYFAGDSTMRQELIALPGTQMEFILSWTEFSHIGTVLIEGRAARAFYKIVVPAQVRLAEMRDLGCPNAPPQPNRPSPPPAQPNANTTPA